MYFVPSWLALFFQVVVFLTLEPLGVDFELPSGPSHPQKPSFHYRKNDMFDKPGGLGSKYVLEGALGSSWVRFWCSWASLGGSLNAFAASRL